MDYRQSYFTAHSISEHSPPAMLSRTIRFEKLDGTEWPTGRVPVHCRRSRALAVRRGDALRRPQQLTDLGYGQRLPGVASYVTAGHPMPPPGSCCPLSLGWAAKP